MTAQTTQQEKQKPKKRPVVPSFLQCCLPVSGSLFVWALLFWNAGMFKLELLKSSSLLTFQMSEQSLLLTTQTTAINNDNDTQHNNTSVNQTFVSSPKPSSLQRSRLEKFARTVPTTTKQKAKTKILAFANGNYKYIAKNWYDELTALGYDNHILVAQDEEAASFFARSSNHNSNRTTNSTKIRFDVWKTDYFQTMCAPMYQQSKILSDKKIHQLYRRTLFASRWLYVLRQLELGFHVLLTDVDNIFVRYLDMQSLEDSDFDAYFAYAGTNPSYPLDIFETYGFSICGGMSWLRGKDSNANSSSTTINNTYSNSSSSSGVVIDLVRELVETCKCHKGLSCSCQCDDQVVLNHLVLERAVWNEEEDVAVLIGTSNHTTKNMTWNGKHGNFTTRNGNALKFKIWNRHTAYRARHDEACPDPNRNWVAMPTGWNRSSLREMWHQTCPAMTTARNE